MGASDANSFPATSEPWYRSATTRTLATIVIAIFAVIAAIPIIRSAFYGVSISAVTAAETSVLFLAIAVALFVVVYSFRQSRASPWTPTAEPGAMAIPSSVIADWLVILNRAWGMWSGQQGVRTSFAVVSRQVLTALNLSPEKQGLGTGGQPKENEWLAQERADAMLAVLDTGSLANSLAVARWMLEHTSKTDENGFWLALEMIQIAIAHSARFADDWILVVREAGGTHLASGIRDDWNTFREEANRLGTDATSLSHKNFQVMGKGTTWSIPAIRGL